MKFKFKVLAAFAATIAIGLLSFSYSPNKAYANNGSGEIDRNAVNKFVEENIMQKLYGIDKSSTKAMMFSRCPSGLRQILAKEQNSSQGYLYGNVYKWQGCDRHDYCEYKIHMGKKIALLRDKNITKFQPVAAYVAAKKKTLKL